MKKLAILFLIIFSCSCAVAQETEVIYQERTNKETERRLLRFEAGIDLTSMVIGVLPLANGGLGQAYTDPDADRILFWDDSEGAFGNLEAGTGLNVTGTTITAENLSNVIFQYSGYDEQTGADTQGVYRGNDQTAAGGAGATLNDYYANAIANSLAYIDMIRFKWTKISGVNTLTVNARAWVELADVTDMDLRLDVGGGAATGDSDTFSNASPAWQTAWTVDVSGLSDGTTYECILQAHTPDDSGTRNMFVSALTVEGS